MFKPHVDTENMSLKNAFYLAVCYIVNVKLLSQFCVLLHTSRSCRSMQEKNADNEMRVVLSRISALMYFYQM